MDKAVVRRGFVALVIAAVMTLMLVGCGGGSSDKSNTDSKADAPAEQSKEVTYESILDEYAQKLKDQAPVLVEEYKSEAAEEKGDVSALAELSNAKVSKLAMTCDEGIAEMAALQQKNKDDYSTYEEWAGKLTDVYTDQAQLITDAYMASAA